jgi:hypothetical protein
MIERRRDPAWLDHVYTLLETVHERGVVNKVALLEVCGELADGKPLTLDALVRIFGVAPMFHLVAIAPDETARQLVREAVDLFVNPESVVNLRDWVRAANAVVGPIATIPRHAPEPDGPHADR